MVTQEQITAKAQEIAARYRERYRQASKGLAKGQRPIVEQTPEEVSAIRYLQRLELERNLAARGIRGSTINRELSKFDFIASGGSQQDWEQIVKAEDANRKLSQRQAQGIIASSNRSGLQSQQGLVNAIQSKQENVYKHEGKEVDTSELATIQSIKGAQLNSYKEDAKQQAKVVGILQSAYPQTAVSPYHLNTSGGAPVYSETTINLDFNKPTAYGSQLETTAQYQANKDKAELANTIQFVATPTNIKEGISGMINPVGDTRARDDIAENKPIVLGEGVTLADLPRERGNIPVSKPQVILKTTKEELQPTVNLINSKGEIVVKNLQTSEGAKFTFFEKQQPQSVNAMSALAVAGAPITRVILDKPAIDKVIADAKALDATTLQLKYAQDGKLVVKDIDINRAPHDIPQQISALTKAGITQYAIGVVKSGQEVVTNDNSMNNPIGILAWQAKDLPRNTDPFSRLQQGYTGFFVNLLNLGSSAGSLAFKDIQTGKLNQHEAPTLYKDIVSNPISAVVASIKTTPVNVAGMTIPLPTGYDTKQASDELGKIGKDILNDPAYYVGNIGANVVFILGTAGIGKLATLGLIGAKELPAIFSQNRLASKLGAVPYGVEKIGEKTTLLSSGIVKEPEVVTTGIGNYFSEKFPLIPKPKETVIPKDIVANVPYVVFDRASKKITFFVGKNDVELQGNKLTVTGDVERHAIEKFGLKNVGKNQYGQNVYENPNLTKEQLETFKQIENAGLAKTIGYGLEYDWKTVVENADLFKEFVGSSKGGMLPRPPEVRILSTPKGYGIGMETPTTKSSSLVPLGSKGMDWWLKQLDNHKTLSKFTDDFIESGAGKPNRVGSDQSTPNKSPANDNAILEQQTRDITKIKSESLKDLAETKLAPPSGVVGATALDLVTNSFKLEQPSQSQVFEMPSKTQSPLSIEMDLESSLKSYKQMLANMLPSESERIDSKSSLSIAQIPKNKIKKDSANLIGSLAIHSQKQDPVSALLSKLGISTESMQPIKSIPVYEVPTNTTPKLITELVPLLPTPTYPISDIPIRTTGKPPTFPLLSLPKLGDTDEPFSGKPWGIVTPFLWDVGDKPLEFFGLPTGYITGYYNIMQFKQKHYKKFDWGY